MMNVWQETLVLLKNRKIQWILTLVLLLFVTLWSSNIRLSNWDVLSDQTTGNKIPSDLDAFYFLRIAETIDANGGSLPEVDVMRNPSYQPPFIGEWMPWANYYMFKVANLFGEYSMAEINAFLPVFFFGIGLVLFFWLSYLITRSRIASLTATTLLAFIPVYLQRTVGGFSDHDSYGITSLFLVLAAFVYIIELIERKKNLKLAFIGGLIIGMLTLFAARSWGGVNTYIFFIIPLSSLTIWFSIAHKEELAKKVLVFYGSWIIFTPLLGILFGFGLLSFLESYMFNSSGLVSVFTFGIILVDFLIIKYQSRVELYRWYKKKYRLAYSGLVTVILGTLLLTFMGKNVFTKVVSAWNTLFHPWGTERISLTVAENAQPYLQDLMGMLSPIIFWLFFGGLLVIGFNFFSHVHDMKRKVLGYFFWIVLVCGALFSRIAPDSIMQGTNFISQTVYIVSLLSFGVYFLWLYFQEKIEVSFADALAIAVAIFVLLTYRAAMRHIFAITPFICLIVGYLIYKMYDYFEKHKGEVLRPVLIILLVISLSSGLYSIYQFENVISAQAQQIGPSANYQWQFAMSWMRENTPSDAIIVHWWDYGYWVQYLGQRRTVTDGGHAVPFWDHLIGRYLLTTPHAEEAFSFMKSHDVSYLLIDPTDLGKYSAYSIIGSDEKGKDRFSAIPVMSLDPKQTLETANQTIIVYTGGMFVDEDIVYNLSGKRVFLPMEKSYIGGVILKMANSAQGMALVDKPTGVYFYNNQRYDIPLRYVYVNNQLVDTGDGLDAVVRIVPSYDGAQSVSAIGAAVYLSPKVAKGLFAQLYLLNNSFGEFDGITLAHSEDDIVVRSLKAQGAPLDEFVFFGGLRGPIKIWSVDYPVGTLDKSEFRRTDGRYAEFDNLTLVA